MALPHRPAPPFDTLPPDLAGVDPADDAAIEALIDQAVADAADQHTPPAVAMARLAASDDAPRWQVTDLGSAEWAMRHVAEAEQALDALTAQREAWQLRIDAWFEHAAARERARLEFFHRHLARYVQALRDQSAGKVKSLDLPSGRVQTRVQAARIDPADDAAVLAWADRNGLLDAVAPPERKLRKMLLREHVHVADVPVHATLVLDTGERVEWWLEADPAAERPSPTLVGGSYGRAWGPLCPGEGDTGVLCSDGSTVDLGVAVVHVDVLAADLVAVDLQGRAVPGVDAEPEHVTVQVRRT